MEAVKTSTVTPGVQRQAAASSIRVINKSPQHTVQPSLKVSSPSDSSELEAVSISKKVMRMPAPVSTAAGIHPGTAKIFRTHAGKQENTILRDGSGQPKVSSKLQSDIQNSFSEGAPLPAGVRNFMEPRFKANFSKVKVHTSEKSAQMSAQLSAKAFTVGEHIFFGKDQFKPDTTEGKELIAHELTHTIQQGSAIQRSEATTVTQRTGAGIQRSFLDSILNFFADKANNIPGYSMLIFILGVNPINMQPVPRTAANLFRGIIGLIPGGNLIYEALQNHGIIDRVAEWIMQKFAELGAIGNSFRDGFNRFKNSLGASDIFSLGSVWDRAVRIFTEPIGRIISFIRSLVTDILKFIKDAILRPLAALAKDTRGYDLLKAILGEDPITGEPVPRNAETLIGGFMKLIGQEEIWENIKRGNAIQRAWTWFQTALNDLMGFLREIPTLFMNALRALEITDIILVPRAFSKLIGVFGDFVGRFISWAGNTIWNLLEIIFSVVAPAAMPYLQKARQAFRTILQDPIGFIRNLLAAAMLGFRQFGTNFLTHLRNSLIQWFTGALPGVYIPQALNLREIIKFILSVLGLTWQNIRVKLVRAIGETAVAAMETGFDIVKTLVTQGPAAAWEKIREAISNLQQMVMDGIMEFVKSKIVEAAITKLMSMLTPAGAFIQAILAIYNTVMFFVERLRQIAQVAASFIDSIAAIAGGVIATAANRVEQTMAGLLTLVISFLARIAGLGRVSDAVMNIINRVRQPIDRALDRVVAWLVSVGRRFVAAVVSGARRGAAAILGWLGLRKHFKVAGEDHDIYFDREAPTANIIVASRNPGLLSNIISTKKWQNKDISDTGIGTLRAQVVIIDSNRREMTRERGEIIMRCYDIITQVLAQEAGVTPPVTAILVKTAIKSGREQMGKILLVEPLSLNPGGLSGSQPTVGSLLGDEMKQKYPNYFVEGHLLNHNLHGPGYERWNLTPLTQKANRNMLSKAERHAKSDVLASGIVLSYKVEVDYPSSGNKPEKQICRGVKITIREMQFNPANRQWVYKTDNLTLPKLEVYIDNDTSTVPNYDRT